MNIDLNVVKKLQFKCLKSCGLCCAFRPQIGDFEIDAIRGEKDFAANYTEENNEYGEKEYYLKLNSTRGAYGACMFLKHDKLCDVYHKRPFKCHLFPFYLRFSDVVQIDADLACSGFWCEKGTNAFEVAKTSLNELYGWDMTKEEEKISDTPNSKAFHKIYRTATEKCNKMATKLISENLYWFKEECRARARNILHLYCDTLGLESIFCAIGNNPFADSIDDLVNHKYPKMGLVENLMNQLIENSFTNKTRPVDHPLFLDSELKWEYLAIDGTDIVIKRFDEIGEITEIARKKAKKLKLTLLQPEAINLLLWYLDVLNSRQSTYDFALITTSETKSNNILTSYLQTLGLFVVEAWSMAQLYSEIKGIPMNAYAFRKGIQAVDNGRVTGPAFDVI